MLQQRMLQQKSAKSTGKIEFARWGSPEAPPRAPQLTQTLEFGKRKSKEGPLANQFC